MKPASSADHAGIPPPPCDHAGDELGRRPHVSSYAQEPCLRFSSWDYPQAVKGKAGRRGALCIPENAVDENRKQQPDGWDEEDLGSKTPQQDQNVPSPPAGAGIYPARSALVGQAPPTRATLLPDRRKVEADVVRGELALRWRPAAEHRTGAHLSIARESPRSCRSRRRPPWARSACRRRRRRRPTRIIRSAC
jgi:hypothetical protein